MGRDRELRERERLCLLEGSREDRRRYFSMLKRVGEFNGENFSAYILHSYESGSLSDSTIQLAKALGYLADDRSEALSPWVNSEELDLELLVYKLWSVQQVPDFVQSYSEYLAAKQLLPLWDRHVSLAMITDSDPFEDVGQAIESDDPYEDLDYCEEDLDDNVLVSEVKESQHLSDNDDFFEIGWKNWQDHVLDIELALSPKVLLQLLKEYWDCPCSVNRRKLESQIISSERWVERCLSQYDKDCSPYYFDFWDEDDLADWLELFLTFIFAARAPLSLESHWYFHEKNILGELNQRNIHSEPEERALWKQKVRSALMLQALKLQSTDNVPRRKCPHRAPVPEKLELGGRVLLLSHAFEGMKGTVLNLLPDKGEARVGVEMFGRTTELQVPFIDLEPLSLTESLET